MAHEHESLLRSTYEAFARGDMDGVLASCSDDIVFHVPGRNQVAGEYRGRQGFMQMIGKVMQLSNGTFAEDVHDIVANDEHGVVLARHALDREGTSYHYETVHVWHIKDGKLADFWEHPNPIVFDQAWA